MKTRVVKFIMLEHFMFKFSCVYFNRATKYIFVKIVSNIPIIII